jgi:hypothetical protein
MGYGCYQVEGGRDAGYEVPAVCDQPGAAVNPGVSTGAGFISAATIWAIQKLKLGRRFSCAIAVLKT